MYQGRGPDGSRVAIKTLHRDLAVEPTVRARFAREAYAANSIEHEGTVRVLADGVDEDEVPYLVMELLEGENYEHRRMRKGGRIEVSEVLWLADRTLEVLAAAHAKGIVHRDVKPENLFLTRDRRLKVLDFGIARLTHPDGPTQAGTVLGTLAFMPPEQARGDSAEISVRSDLWAVGATMFNLLSGRLIRDGDDARKLLRDAGNTGVASLATVTSGLPPELVDLVDSAMRLDVNVRWPTARMMRRAIRLVHAKVNRRPPAPRAEDEDDDERGVSEPYFGVIATHSIEPPPISVAAPSQAQVAIAPLPPPPSDLVQHAATLVAPGTARGGIAPATLAATAARAPWQGKLALWVTVAAAALALALVLVLLARR